MPLQNTPAIAGASNPITDRANKPSIGPGASNRDITARDAGAPRLQSPAVLFASKGQSRPSVRTRFTDRRDFAAYVVERSDGAMPDLDMTIRRRESLEGIGRPPG